MSSASDIRDAFLQRLDRPLITEKLFDNVQDTTFFVKDHLGRYVCANQTQVDRCGLKTKDEIIGKTVMDVYSEPLAASYAEQDRQVLKTAKSITAELELTLYSDGKQGWCLTYKEPVLDKAGKIIGIVGISRDLNSPTQNEGMASIAKVMEHIREHISEPLRLVDIAEVAGLSVYQLDQRIRALYQMSAGQCITRARIDAACHLLFTTGKSIASIAQDCGYSDQSAFTRQFKQTTGITPKAYRERRRV